MDTTAIASTQEQQVARQTRQAAANSATVLSFAQFMVNVQNAAQARESDGERQVDAPERPRQDESLDDAGEAERGERQDADRGRDAADGDQVRQGQEPATAKALGNAGDQPTDADGATAAGGAAPTQADEPTAVDGIETAATEPSHQSDANGHGPSSDAAAEAAAAAAADPAAAAVPAQLLALLAQTSGQTAAAQAQSPDPQTEAVAVAATPNGTATALPGLATTTPAAGRQRGGNAAADLPGQATQALTGAGQSAAAKASIAANAIPIDAAPVLVEETAAPLTDDIAQPNAAAPGVAKDTGDSGRIRATLLSDLDLGGHTRHNPPAGGAQGGPAAGKASALAQPQTVTPQAGNGQPTPDAAAAAQLPSLAPARPSAQAVAVTADGIKAVGDPLAQNLGSGTSAGINSADPAAAATAARAGRAPVPAHPAAEQVAVRFHKAIADGADKIEIQLKPAALGRVKVALEVGHDGRVLAVVTASNPDTLDMLKHSSQVLERALQDAGLKADSNSLSFTLGGGEDRTAAFAGNDRTVQEPDADGGDLGADLELVAAPPLYRGTGSGLLDIHV